MTEKLSTTNESTEDGFGYSDEYNDGFQEFVEPKRDGFEVDRNSEDDGFGTVEGQQDIPESERLDGRDGPIRRPSEPDQGTPF